MKISSSKPCFIKGTKKAFFTLPKPKLWTCKAQKKRKEKNQLFTSNNLTSPEPAVMAVNWSFTKAISLNTAICTYRL